MAEPIEPTGSPAYTDLVTVPSPGDFVTGASVKSAAQGVLNRLEALRIGTGVSFVDVNVSDDLAVVGDGSFGGTLSGVGFNFTGSGGVSGSLSVLGSLSCATFSASSLGTFNNGFQVISGAATIVPPLTAVGGISTSSVNASAGLSAGIFGLITSGDVACQDVIPTGVVRTPIVFDSDTDPGMVPGRTYLALPTANRVWNLPTVGVSANDWVEVAIKAQNATHNIQVNGFVSGGIVTVSNTGAGGHYRRLKAVFDGTDWHQIITD